MTKAHLEWVRGLPCSVAGCMNAAHAHHVRTAANSGMGLKPDDKEAVPLCAAHHAEGHRIGWRSFEVKYNVDLKATASWCAKASGSNVP